MHDRLVNYVCGRKANALATVINQTWSVMGKCKQTILNRKWFGNASTSLDILHPISM
jgi:hypothetical protein